MRVALVTGSARGLGLAIARRFSDDGYGVILHGRDEEVLASAVADIGSGGASAMFVTGDVKDPDAVTAMVGRILDTHGRIDVLVNNVGHRAYAPVAEMTSEDWAEVLAVTLDGAFNCIRQVVPTMMGQGWGRIINISGISGQRGGPMHVAIATAKAGIIGMTKALGLELGPHGITVNSVSPARIESGRTAPVDPHARLNHDRIHDSDDIPVRRLGTVAEVAAACSYLCSDDAGYVTGQVLSLNGGLYT